MGLMAGDVRNRLTILEVRSVDRTFKTGTVRRVKEVRARCVCGREKWFRHEHVTGDRAKSCGCLNYEPRCRDPRLRIARRVLAYLRVSARKRGLPFDLTETATAARIFEPCFYCGAAPSRVLREPARPFGRRGAPCHGLDRVNADRGYTIDNIVACCFVCNTMKWDLSPEDFLRHVESLAARADAVRVALATRSRRES
jgi:hypothetical protein